MPIVLISCYLLLDRRPLRRRIPVLACLTVRRETSTGLLVMLALLAAWIVATVIAQV